MSTTIKASDIAKMIDEGTERKAIAEHYGIPQNQLNKLIKSTPSLKGRKRKKQFDFEFVDDLSDTTDLSGAPEDIKEAIVANTEALDAQDSSSTDENLFSNKDERPAEMSNNVG